MEYRIDHDYHIHSLLSPCSSDPLQTNEAILAHGEKLGLKDIVLTDHFWDHDVLHDEADWIWEGYERISKALPLPVGTNTRFHFGCECDMDRFSVVGVSPHNYDKFDFIIVPINHLHLPFSRVQRNGTDKRTQAAIFVQRFQNLLMLGLPFEKVGLAHITWAGVCGFEDGWKWQNHLDILNMVPDEKWRMLFSETAERGMGVELNVSVGQYKTEDEIASVMRPYIIAKECGCRFYLGSDAHHPSDFDGFTLRAQTMISRLGLSEDDKFRPFG